MTEAHRATRVALSPTARRIDGPEGGNIRLEGRIFDASAAEEGQLLTDLLAAFAAGENCDQRLRHLLRRDFEGVIVADDEQGRTLVMSDLMGRLPVYYSTQPTPVFSRDVGRVLEAGAGAPDPIGAAQYLTFNYCLGDRTPFAGVKLLPPGAIATVGRGSLTLRTLDALSLEPARADRGVRANAGDLADLFTEVTGRRATERNIVSMSGGLDSRSVVAALLRGGADFRMVSFAAGGTSVADVAVGRQIADVMGKSFGAHEVDPTSLADAERLLEATRGQNIGQMGFILRFFDWLIEHGHEGATMFTGDGGDKAMPPLAPGRPIRNDRDLVKHLIETQGVFRPDKAAEIAGCSPGDLLDSIHEVVAAYPDETPRRFARWLVSERARRFTYTGEERNRLHFDHSAPFFAPAFFAESLAVPDRQKKHHQLYREFLRALSPELLAVPYANTGTSIDSTRFVVEESARRMVKRVVSPEFIRAKVLRRAVPTTLGLPEADLRTGAPGLKLGGYVDNPPAYSARPAAPWVAHSLAWMYRNLTPSS